jgi:hypothetical protein
VGAICNRDGNGTDFRWPEIHKTTLSKARHPIIFLEILENADILLFIRGGVASRSFQLNLFRGITMNNIIKAAAVASLVLTSASAFAWGNGPFNGLTDMANDFFGDGFADGNANFNMSMSGSANGSGRGYGRGYDRFQGYNGYQGYGYAPNYGYMPYYGAGQPGAPVAMAAPQAPVAPQAPAAQ